MQPRHADTMKMPGVLFRRLADCLHRAGTLGYLDRADVRGATSDVAGRFRSNLDRSVSTCFFSEIRQAGTWRLLRRWRIATPNEMFGCRREKPAWLIVPRSRQAASGCWWSGWVRGRLAVVPMSSLRRQLGCEIGWTSGRGLHCGRMISGWALDVFQFDCRGKIPYCCVTAGNRCVFLARNYDRAMRLRSDAREHRQQNHNSACVHVASLPGPI